MHLFYEPNATAGELNTLNSDESRHAIKVLRLQTGDEILVIDGRGNFFQSKIVEADARKCSFEVIHASSEERRSGYRHIAIAPTKNLDRIEWFVEKAVEIGVDRLSFVLCDNSERRVLKLERLERKAISAMKQSMKASLPIIDEMISFKEFIDKEYSCNKFIAHVDFSNPKHLKEELEIDNLVLIGPEGDFSDDEIDLSKQAGYTKVSLGESRLRTETAGIVAAHLLNLI